MKKIKLKLTFLIFAVLFVCSSVLFLVNSGNKAGAYAEGDLSEPELKTQYFVGDSLDMSGAKIISDGTSYNVQNIFLYFPDGTVKGGVYFVFSEAGNYRLVCVSSENNTTLYSENTITVNMPLYGGTTAVYTDELSTHSNGKSGLEVELSGNSTFQFNMPVNISDASLNGSPIITFTPYQYSLNKANTVARRQVGDRIVEYPAVKTEANKYIVRITDCYDSENYIEINISTRSQSSSDLCFIYPDFSARASGQEVRAITPPSEILNRYGDLVYIDGVQYLVRNPLFAFSYVWSNLKQDGEISIYFDYENYRLYAGFPSASGEVNLFFAALGLEEIYGENVFKGFTTGEVYVSVYATDFVSDKAGFTVSEIYGIKGADLNVDFVKDKLKPVIKSDINENKTYFIAYNSDVIIPSANVYDVNSGTEPEVRVYYAYGTDKQVSVNVKNGKFKTEKLGEYVIEYSATDAFGNKSDPYVIRLNSIETDKDSVIDFKVNELDELQSAGTMLEIPEYTISGLNGYTYVNAYAFFSETPESLMDFSDGLILSELGEYTIVYEYGDYFEKNIYSYTISACSSDEILFGEIYLPKYFINNAVYTLDDVSAYAYSDGTKKLVTTEYYVSEDNGEYRKIDYSAYKVNAEQNVQFKYVAGDGKYVVSSPVRVVEVGFGTDDSSFDMSKYFYGDFETSSSFNGVALVSNTEYGDNGFDFINEVSLSDFQLMFSSVTGKESFTGVDIVLTDYYNANIKVTLGFSVLSDQTIFYVNGEKVTVTSKFTGGENISVYYDQTSQSFIDVSGTSIAWENAFTTDRAFMQIVLKGIHGESGIQISRICNQKVSQAKRDNVASYIKYNNEYGGVAKKGETVTVYPAYAIDVLSPFDVSNMKISVTDSKGVFMRATDGTLLDGNVIANRSYDVVLDGFDTYFVYYNYKDAYNNSAVSQYSFYVKDVTCPVIRLDNNLTSDSVISIKVNERHNLSGYTVWDDFPVEQVTVTVFLIKDNLLLKKITDKTILFTEKGKYTVMYYCCDAAGNYSTASYGILVK